LTQTGHLPASAKTFERLRLSSALTKVIEQAVKLLRCIVSKRRFEVGQSMSALPKYFRHQLVPLLSPVDLARCRSSVTAAKTGGSTMTIQPEFATVQTNGIRLRVALAGKGPLVVLVHGWPESWYSWRH
jgi:hypothetical protein